MATRPLSSQSCRARTFSADRAGGALPLDFKPGVTSRPSAWRTSTQFPSDSEVRSSTAKSSSHRARSSSVAFALSFTRTPAARADLIQPSTTGGTERCFCLPVCFTLPASHPFRLRSWEPVTVWPIKSFTQSLKRIRVLLRCDYHFRSVLV